MELQEQRHLKSHAQTVQCDRSMCDKFMGTCWCTELLAAFLQSHTGPRRKSAWFL